jgi:hypothetical protein
LARYYRQPFAALGDAVRIDRVESLLERVPYF